MEISIDLYNALVDFYNSHIDLYNEESESEFNREDRYESCIDEVIKLLAIELKDENDGN